jgi:hypothetical protein
MTENRSLWPCAVYLWLVDLTEERQGAAFVGSLIFAFCPYRMARIAGHLPLVGTQGIPLVLWGLERFWQRRRLSDGLLISAGLFAVTLCAAYAAGLRLVADRRTARLVVLLLAFPPVLLTLYTTVSLGGYNEVLLAGTLLIGWGHRLGWEDTRRWTLWLAWGLVAGLGFWVLGLVIVYVLPVALWLAWRLRARCAVLDNRRAGQGDSGAWPISQGRRQSHLHPFALLPVAAPALLQLGAHAGAGYWTGDVGAGGFDRVRRGVPAD